MGRRAREESSMEDEPDVQTPEATPEAEPTAEEIEGTRRAQKDRNRRLAMQEELATLRGEKADRETKDREAEQAKLREQGDFEKIEADLRTQLRDRDEKLSTLNEKVDGFGKAERQGKFLDAIMGAGGITNRRVAKAMLGTLDIETAPEHFTDKDARDAAKLLRKEAPEIFGAGSSTDPKPPPGSGKTPPEKGTHEYYKAVGAAFTDRGANTPYAIARKAATGQ